MIMIDPLSETFKQSGLWKRLLEYVGGNEKRAIEWWDIPIGATPFKNRTPRQLMNEQEWDKVRIFLETRNPISTHPYNYGPSNYYKTAEAMLVVPKSRKKTNNEI